MGATTSPGGKRSHNVYPQEFCFWSKQFKQVTNQVSNNTRLFHKAPGTVLRHARRHYTSCNNFRAASFTRTIEKMIGLHFLIQVDLKYRVMAAETFATLRSKFIDHSGCRFGSFESAFKRNNESQSTFPLVVSHTTARCTIYVTHGRLHGSYWRPVLSRDSSFRLATDTTTGRRATIATLWDST